MNASKPRAKKPPVAIQPLDSEARVNLPTCEAARHLNRSQQTLRVWAYRGIGPIKPIRIGGQLAWPVAALRELNRATS